MASEWRIYDEHDDNDNDIDRLEVSIYPIKISSNLCLSLQA